MLPIVDDSADVDARGRSDAALAVIAAVSTLAFAWAGFQSAEWVRERFLLSDESAAASEQALELAAEADRLEERDTILFVEWLVALDSGQTETAAIVFNLFRPPVQEFVRTIDVNDQGVPTETLFDSGEYDVVRLREQSAALDREAAEKTTASNEASKTAARYGGLGLLFVAVLACSGVATRFGRRIRRPLIVITGALLTIGLLAMTLTRVSFLR